MIRKHFIFIVIIYDSFRKATSPELPQKPSGVLRGSQVKNQVATSHHLGRKTANRNERPEKSQVASNTEKLRNDGCLGEGHVVGRQPQRGHEATFQRLHVGADRRQDRR